jgi:outer membrane protein assembly factor BamE (lipoprotein component of BamABCDE complex)
MRYLTVSRMTALFGVILLAGCASYGAVDGVDNLWREVSVDEFEKGVTTQSDVLDRLGPPSQLINLQNQTVFYYLTEEMSGQGKIFIIWNQASAESKYDRAIFFFDTDGVLQEFAYSKEEIGR